MPAPACVAGSGASGSRDIDDPALQERCRARGRVRGGIRLGRRKVEFAAQGQPFFPEMDAVPGEDFLSACFFSLEILDDAIGLS